MDVRTCGRFKYLISIPLEKFEQVSTLSHTRFSHNKWWHWRDLWRQGKFCFSSMAVSPKRLSYFLYCEYGIRDCLKYNCDISVFIFQVVS